VIGGDGIAKEPHDRHPRLGRVVIGAKVPGLGSHRARMLKDLLVIRSHAPAVPGPRTPKTSGS
jgi:hypothetical protein